MAAADEEDGGGGDVDEVEAGEEEIKGEEGVVAEADAGVRAISDPGPASGAVAAAASAEATACNASSKAAAAAATVHATSSWRKCCIRRAWARCFSIC